MSKKDDEQYGVNSAAAASVNSAKNSGGSGFSSFSQNNGVQSTGSFQTSQEAANNNANSSIASVSYTSSPSISQSGFSALSSKSTDPSFSMGQSSDGESFGNATSVQSVSVPDSASFAPVMLETSQANLSPKEELLNLRENQNVQKFLGLIRFTEGTDKFRDPYAVTFGGRTFDTSANHPGTLFSFKTKSGKSQKTSAHGAYQFLSRTWDEKAKKYDLDNMSPENQDVAALALIQDKDALQDVLEGNFDEAISKTGGVWASLPSAPASYDQPKVSSSSIDKYLSQADVAFNDVGLPEGGNIPTPILEETDQNAPISTAMAYAGPEVDQNSPFDAVLTEPTQSKGFAALVKTQPNIKFARAEQADVKPELKAVLNSISSATGQEILVNSGYRSPEYNKKVNGAKKSAHVEKIAADLAFMHNKSARNIDQAPGWFQQIASGGKTAQPSQFSQNAATPSAPSPTSTNVSKTAPVVQTPTERVDKYTASPDAPEQPQGLSGKQKVMAGVIDAGSSFIPGIGTAIGIANGVASMTGNKTLGERLVGGNGFNVKPSSLDYGQGETSDYAEIERLRKLEEERLAAEEAEALAAAQTPKQSIDRYLTANNAVWRPSANERFGVNANNYR